MFFYSEAQAAELVFTPYSLLRATNLNGNNNSGLSQYQFMLSVKNLAAGAAADFETASRYYGNVYFENTVPELVIYSDGEQTSYSYKHATLPIPSFPSVKNTWALGLKFKIIDRPDWTYSRNYPIVSYDNGPLLLWNIDNYKLSSIGNSIGTRVTTTQLSPGKEYNLVIYCDGSKIYVEFKNVTDGEVSYISPEVTHDGVVSTNYIKYLGGWENPCFAVKAFASCDYEQLDGLKNFLNTY